MKSKQEFDRKPRPSTLDGEFTNRNYKHLKLLSTYKTTLTRDVHEAEPN